MNSHAILQTKSWSGAPIQDLGFGTWLENSLQWQNLGLLDKIGTFLGPFWDLSGTFCRYFDDTTAKQYRRLKRHIVATFSAKSGLFENHFRTFTGNLDYILINIWRKCLIKYLMQVDIPDHLKPNVFLIRASGRPTGGLYTCNSLIYWNKTEIWDLGGKIGTFLGPFLHFGPIWDQVPNSGPYRSACLGPKIGTLV